MKVFDAASEGPASALGPWRRHIKYAAVAGFLLATACFLLPQLSEPNFEQLSSFTSGGKGVGLLGKARIEDVEDSVARTIREEKYRYVRQSSRCYSRRLTVLQHHNIYVQPI